MTIENLPKHLIGISKIINEIINDVKNFQQDYVQKEKEEPVPTDYFVTAREFALTYCDLVSVWTIRRILRTYPDYFKGYTEKSMQGIRFCPQRMLEYLERHAGNWLVKNRCQKYLIEFECD